MAYHPPRLSSKYVYRPHHTIGESEPNKDNEDVAMRNSPLNFLEGVVEHPNTVAMKALSSELSAAPESLEQLCRHVKVRITSCSLRLNAKDSPGRHNIMHLNLRICETPASLLSLALSASKSLAIPGNELIQDMGYWLGIGFDVRYFIARRSLYPSPIRSRTYKIMEGMR
jgi:hypothetical protein